MLRHFILISTICMSGLLIQAQGVVPLSLFKSGLNMGYLHGHHQKGTPTGELPTYAGNASAEWMASWSPDVLTPASVQVDRPQRSHEDLITTMRDMPSCANNWFNLRLSLYRLGYSIGMATVETGYGCSACLRTHLQGAAIEARTIARLVGIENLTTLSTTLTEEARALDLALEPALQRQQNEGMMSFLVQTIQSIENELPGKMEKCATPDVDERDEEEVSNNVVKPSKPGKRDISKRLFNLIYCRTGGALIGNGGSSSFGGGMSVGFSTYRGRRVHFITGLDFYRNNYGVEWFVPSPGQVQSRPQYVQGFRTQFGLGGYIILQDKVRWEVHAALRFVVASLLEGGLSSIGNFSLEGGGVNAKIGGTLHLYHLLLHFSIEPGVRRVASYFGQPYKSSAVNFGFGVWF